MVSCIRLGAGISTSCRPLVTVRLLRDTVEVQEYSINTQDAETATAKSFSSIPGPKPLPVVGNIPTLYASRTKEPLFFDKCFKEYGDIFKLNLFGKLK